METSKRIRRTNAALADLRSQLRAIAESHQPLTLKQLYEHAVRLNLVATSKPGYQVVCRILSEMRLSGEIPHEWIVSVFAARCIA